MKQILVVDDLPEIRLVYSALFDDPEVEVLEAGDGREALQVLEVESVDLVLTDCKMPNMTGVELMQEAQSRSSFHRCIFHCAAGGPEGIGSLCSNAQTISVD